MQRLKKTSSSFWSLALLLSLSPSVVASADQESGRGALSGRGPVLPARDYFPDGNALGKNAATASATYNFNAYPRLINGPPQNRVNIGTTGDGYAIGDTVNFPAHADSNIAYRRGLSSIKNNKMAMRPYPRYDKFFNWYYVNLVSPEAGISAAPSYGQPNTKTVNNALRLSGSGGEKPAVPAGFYFMKIAAGSERAILPAVLNGE